MRSSVLSKPSSYSLPREIQLQHFEANALCQELQQWRGLHTAISATSAHCKKPLA